MGNYNYSDEELNKRLNRLILGTNLPCKGCIDYCNNTAETMDLAFMYGISLTAPDKSKPKRDQKWSAKYDSDDEKMFWTTNLDKYPLRAVVMCLISIREYYETGRIY